MSINSTTARILPVSMSPDDPRTPPDRDQEAGRRDPSGASTVLHDRRKAVQVFDAQVDARGEWRLDEAAGGGWTAKLKQLLLVALSLAVAATLWVFAFALMLVLLPLVALAGWWMWRRLQAMQRAHMARTGGSDPL